MSVKSSCLVLLLCTATAWLSGCGSSASFSASSESISNIVTSPFESSSDSSGADTAYRDDLRVLTLATLESSGGEEGFLRGIGEVAERYGIVDWEGIPETYVAIGEGLREAGLSLEEARAFSRRIFGDDPRAEALVGRAYHS